MKLITSVALLGAVSVAAVEQKVLGDPLAAIEDAAGSWQKPLAHLKEILGEMTDEAKSLWDEMSLLIPGALDKSSVFSSPKPHFRKPDSHWDYIVRGADVQGLWVESEGVKHRKVGGRLENYNLRAKGVDPSGLGIDTVKQYSGYLDDEENDKHLFYCKFVFPM